MAKAQRGRPFETGPEAKKTYGESASPEDLLDIALAAEVKAVYLKKGKSAFTPLKDYQKRRRDK